jgi:hypothetical protein
MVNLSATQLGYVNTIVSVGNSLGMTHDDITTAITVALDESEIQVLANPKVPESLKIPHDGLGTDGSSVGIFQQQVTEGWGTAAECMDVTHSATSFYNALKAVPGRQSMPISIKAQAVQKSGDPTGSNYLMRESDAKQIVASLGGSGTSDSASTTPAPGGGTQFNWQRVGIFALGAVLIIIAGTSLLDESDTVKAVTKAAVKIA